MNPIESIKRYYYPFTILCVFLLIPSSLFPGNNPNESYVKETDGFIENKGQIIDQNNKSNPGVLFLLNTPGMNVQLREGGFSYDLYRISNIDYQTSKSESSSSIQPSSHPVIQYHRIDLDLFGCNPNCQVVTNGQSSDYLNYYTTGTPDEGITGVRSYQTVTYKDVYPGIDLEFISGAERPFEYNFVVRPGADPSVIRIRISGPEKIRSFSDGIVYRTSIGKVEETIPLCYYKLEDVSVPVEGRFRKMAEHFYGFVIEQPVPEGATLVIDPIPTRRWGTYYGGAGGTNIFNRSCATDGNGNVIITGSTGSTDNIATAGAYQTTHHGNGDAFIAKFATNGQRLWGTYYGGSQGEGAFSCAVDHDNNIIMVGNTHSTDFIASPGAFQAVLHGNVDGMIVKFSSAGQRLWGTYYGGNEVPGPWNTDNVEVCSVDSSGNIYAAGITNSPDFIASPGAHQTVFGGIRDNYLVKFSPDGQRLWGTYYGGTFLEQNPSCAASKSGFVYLTGNTASENNIATPGSWVPVLTSAGLGFLAAFDTDGQRLWGTYYGGPFGDIIYGCTADTGSAVYVYGSGTSLIIGTPGVFQPLCSGLSNACLSKFSSSGEYLWGTFCGGDNTRILNAAVDDSGFVFVTGWSYNQDSIVASPNAYQTIFRGGYSEDFLAKFTSTGQRFWGTYYGGTGNDNPISVAVDDLDNIYINGFTSSENFSDNSPLCTRSALRNHIATPGSFQQENLSVYTSYLVKFSDCYSPDTAAQIYGPLSLCRNSTGVVFSIDPLISATSYQWCVTGNLTITSGQGTTSITVDVGPGLGTDTISVYGINACDNGFPKIITRRINPRPIPVISGTDTTCTGAATLYSTAGGKSMYQWMVSPGGAVVSGGGTGDSTCTVSWSTGGAQWIRVIYTDTTGCQADSPAQFNVWVVAGPTVGITIAPSANQVCTGTSVIFTAIPQNEGTLPFYQWKVNGISVGSNTTLYSYIPANGDVVQCILTSNLACASGNPATSNSVIMVVNPNLPVSVSVSPSLNPVCAGTLVAFIATPTYGGLTPSYQWKVNGGNVGTNSSTYSYTPNNGDVITCTLTSSETCTTGNPVISNQVTMTVNPLLPVSISISPSSNPFCIGSSVTFTTTPTYPGTTPVYQWKVNGLNVGANNISYTYNPMSGDVVTCVLTSSEACASGNPATSNTITVTGILGVPAGVSITAVPNPFCPGSSVTCTATPNNGGTNPVYQWKVNGVNVGTNLPTYTFNPLNNDSVRCVMTSNLACVSGNPASSDKIVLSGTLAPVVTFTSCFDTITTLNAKPIRLKGGIPLNGTYSGPGVNSATGVFTPSAAGTGTRTITYTYTNAALCSASKARIVIVQTTPAFTCGNNLKDIRDNQVYPTVPIGSQCWMASNLNYGSLIPGTTHQRDNCINEKFCYNNLPVNCGIQTYYQWDELMRYDDTPAQQGLCPPGWHVPTEADWNALFANWTNNGFAGSPLKYSGFSGFDAILSGVRHHAVQWDYASFAVFCWSSTSHGHFKAWAHGMNEADPSVSRYPSLRSNAFSVRCLKD